MPPARLRLVGRLYVNCTNTRRC